MDGGIAFALLATVLVLGIAPASAPAATGARSSAAPSVTVAFLPSGTSPGTLAASDGISAGLLSAGLSKVPADQTYLDIGQGNRVFDSLYDEALPRLFTLDGRVPPVLWRAVVERADSAPADIVPGLLATSLERAGRSARATADAGSAALVAANGEGRVRTAATCCPGEMPAARSRAAGMTITSVEPGRLPSLVRGLRGEDLLIAIERPPPEEDGRQLSIGIAGRGFEGQLTSDSTRLDGLVLSTDLAPTILERLDVEVPEEMSGSTIRADGAADPARLLSLEDRIAGESTLRAKLSAERRRRRSSTSATSSRPPASSTDLLRCASPPHRDLVRGTARGPGGAAGSPRRNARRHARERLRRAGADDRHRLHEPLRRLRMGDALKRGLAVLQRRGALLRSLDAYRPRYAVFLDL